MTAQPSAVEIAPSAFGLLSVVDATDSTPSLPDPADAERKPPRGKSITHFDLVLLMVDGFDNSAVAVVDHLLRDNNLSINAHGRVLYTDNWYTTMKLACHLYNKYGY